MCLGRKLLLDKHVVPEQHSKRSLISYGFESFVPHLFLFITIIPGLLMPPITLPLPRDNKLGLVWNCKYTHCRHVCAAWPAGWDQHIMAESLFFSQGSNLTLSLILLPDFTKCLKKHNHIQHYHSFNFSQNLICQRVTKIIRYRTNTDCVSFVSTGN